MSRYEGQPFIGLDLGQAQDFTAIAVLFQRKEPLAPIETGWRHPHVAKRPVRTQTVYDCPHLARLPLGTPYPGVVDCMLDLLKTDGLAKARLVVDETGVGRPVIDMLRKYGLGGLVPITITAGITVTQSSGAFHVPKRDLVGVLRALTDYQRLRVAKGLKAGEVFKSELRNFKVKIDPTTAHDSYGSWREGEHDDLVLAVALATWCGEYSHRNVVRVASCAL